MRRIGASAIAAMALLAAEGAAAQDAPEACATGAPALGRFAAWSAREPMRATPGAYDLPVARLELGQAVEARLVPVGDVAYVVEPERWPEPETKGGMLGFHAPVAGTYSVALGVGAWIDVAEGDGLVGSTAFGPGPACSGIAKIVSFPLLAGEHVLQLSGSPEDRVGVLVVFDPQ